MVRLLIGKSHLQPHDVFEEGRLRHLQLELLFHYHNLIPLTEGWKIYHIAFELRSNTIICLRFEIDHSSAKTIKAPLAASHVSEVSRNKILRGPWHWLCPHWIAQETGEDERLPPRFSMVTLGQQRDGFAPPFASTTFFRFRNWNAPSEVECRWMHPGIPHYSRPETTTKRKVIVCCKGTRTL